MGGPMLMWGSDLVLRDGAPVGQVTSAAWGETLGAAVGLAYVTDPAGPPVTRDFPETGSYTVNVAGQLIPATVSLRAPYDPSGARAR